jgi:hypothetical protein
MLGRVGLALVAVALSPDYGRAQGASPCPEFRVNTYTTGEQDLPALAADPSGNFVAVWQSNGQDGSAHGIVAQRFSAGGTPSGSEFQVNTYTTGEQRDPHVASDAAGNFVVVWTGAGQDGDGDGIFGQRFDTGGAAQGPEFQVNSLTPAHQVTPTVAADATGNFVVVWVNLPASGFDRDVRGRLFDASGVPRGPDFPVNTYTTGIQAQPSVASDSAGNFVIVWESGGQDGSVAGVFGQRFDVAGTPQGSEFPVNSYTTDSQSSPVVAFDGAGDFVVAWSGEGASGFGIQGRRFHADGVPFGPEFRVSDTPATQVAMTYDSLGGLVAVWEGVDGSKAGVRGRRFSSSGLSLGPEFQVNAFTMGNQRRAAVAAEGSGGFVTAWFNTDGDVSASLDCARLYTVAPCRVLDTRGPPALPLAANTTRTFPVSGLCGIPPGARAVAINATAVNPTEAGDLRLFPAGLPIPNASTLNFRAGVTRANNALVPLSTDGQIAVRCDMVPGSQGHTNLALDVYGYFAR